MSQPHASTRELLIDQAAAGVVQLTLSLARTGSAEAYLLLHSTAYVQQAQDLHLVDFFRQFGFEHFEGPCPYYVQGCYYLVVGTMSLYYPGAEQKHPIVGNLGAIAKLLNESFGAPTAQTGNLKELIGARDKVWSS